MSADTVLGNARIVLAGRVIEGSVRISDGRIAAVREGAAPPDADDLDGDHLIPGCVDLHSDCLEGHLEPRRGVFWDGRAAVAAHDAVTVAAGITTVFDAVCLGRVAGRPMNEQGLEVMLASLDRARRDGGLRADHRVHLRCEVTDPRVTRLLEGRIGNDLVGIVSVMDHAPGHRQMKDPAYLRDVWLIGTHGMSPADADREVADLVRRSREIAPGHRREVVRMAREHGILAASHDDETVEHIELAAGSGIAVAEFPTSLAAARAARERGIAVLMGGPNLVRGGSHSGNVGAGELAGAGLLDALVSDYVMSSMLMGAFALADAPHDWNLADAIALVTANPARIAGLDDRGRIAVGLRADLARVRMSGGTPVVGAVWRAGRRVY